MKMPRFRKTSLRAKPSGLFSVKVDSPHERQKKPSPEKSDSQESLTRQRVKSEDSFLVASPMPSLEGAHDLLKDNERQLIEIDRAARL